MGDNVANTTENEEEATLYIEEDYKKALNNYFQLKKKYETNILNDKKKLKITGGNIEEFIPKCIICKKPGGTIFKNTKKQYHCYCNANGEKCRLNIKLKKGENNHFFEHLHYVKERTELSRQIIIMTKLDILFDYVTTNYVARELDSQLEKEQINSDMGGTLLQRFHEIFTNAKKQELQYKILSDIQELQQQLLDKKEAAQLISNENDNDRNILIREIVEIQIKKLKPLLENLRKAKYDEMYVTQIESENSDIVQNVLVQIEHGVDKYINNYIHPVVVKNDY